MAEGKPKVALIGFMGSGKTAVGRKLAARLGVEWMDTDLLVEREAGMTIPEFFARHGEGEFRKLERDGLAKLAATLESGVVSCGGGIVLDKANRDTLKSGFYTVWLSVRPETVIARVEKGSRPLLECADPLGRARALLAHREQFYVEASSFFIETDGLTPDQVAEVIYDSIPRT